MKKEMLRVYGRVVVFVLAWLDNNYGVHIEDDDMTVVQTRVLHALWNSMFRHGLFESQVTETEALEAIESLDKVE